MANDLRDTLAKVLANGLFKPTGRDAKLVATGLEAMLLGPDVSEEWHAADVIAARLGITAMTIVDNRIGIVGRKLDEASIAYWVGNVAADYPVRPGIAAGKLKLRATFVFEKRKDGWTLVQGHLSQPTLDDDLATFVFGTALISPKPLDVTCDDGSSRIKPVPLPAPKAPPPARP